MGEVRALKGEQKMSRPYIYIQTEKASLAKLEEVNSIEENVVKNLVEYLEDYQPERIGASKSSMMGPVGKLISAISAGRFENKIAIVGFVANIHNNVSKTPLSQNAFNRLSAAVDGLEKLRKIVPSRMWLRVLREIDYAVFAKQYEKISLNSKR